MHFLPSLMAERGKAQRQDVRIWWAGGEAPPWWPLGGAGTEGAAPASPVPDPALGAEGHGGDASQAGGRRSDELVPGGARAPAPAAWDQVAQRTGPARGGSRGGRGRVVRVTLRLPPAATATRAPLQHASGAAAAAPATEAVVAGVQQQQGADSTSGEDSPAPVLRVTRKWQVRPQGQRQQQQPQRHHRHHEGERGPHSHRTRESDGAFLPARGWKQPPAQQRPHALPPPQKQRQQQRREEQQLQQQQQRRRRQEQSSGMEAPPRRDVKRSAAPTRGPRPVLQALWCARTRRGLAQLVASRGVERSGDVRVLVAALSTHCFLTHQRPSAR